MTSLFLRGSVFHMKQRSPELVDVILAFGSLSELARQLGLTRQAVSSWDKVPLKHMKTISQLTGIPRHKLRPDIYA